MHSLRTASVDNRSKHRRLPPCPRWGLLNAQLEVTPYLDASSVFSRSGRHHAAHYVPMAPLSSLAPCANRSAARAGARAFRGINGRLPAVVSLWRAPSIYSTVPLRPRFIAALSVSHGDRRMRGRTQLTTAPDAEGSTALPVSEAAPSEIRAGALWKSKGNDVAMRSDIEKDRVGRQFLRTVAMCFKRGALRWPGVPP